MLLDEMDSLQQFFTMSMVSVIFIALLSIMIQMKWFTLIRFTFLNSLGRSSEISQ